MLTKKRCILITGASRGIGQALALRLADDGDHIIGLSRSGCRCHDGASMMDEHHIYCDLSDLDSVAAVGQQLQRRFPVIDTLIHNAAVGFYGSVEEQQNVEALLHTNVHAPILLTRLLAANLFASANPRVVFISSVHSQFPAAQFAAYAASKRALEGFARSLREEWSGRVEVQVLFPGPTATEMPQRAGMPMSAQSKLTLADPTLVADKIATCLQQPPKWKTLFWSDRWLRLIATIFAPLLDRYTARQTR